MPIIVQKCTKCRKEGDEGVRNGEFSMDILRFRSIPVHRFQIPGVSLSTSSSCVQENAWLTFWRLGVRDPTWSSDEPLMNQVSTDPNQNPKVKPQVLQAASQWEPRGASGRVCAMEPIEEGCPATQRGIHLGCGISGGCNQHSSTNMGFHDGCFFYGISWYFLNQIQRKKLWISWDIVGISQKLTNGCCWKKWSSHHHHGDGIPDDSWWFLDPIPNKNGWPSPNIVGNIPKFCDFF